MQKKDIERILVTYYDALEEGKILGRKCTVCGHIEFPPYLACNTCGGLDTQWCEMSGKGMMTQLMKSSPAFTNKAFRERVGEYAVGCVQPEGSDEYDTCFIGIGADRVDELRGRLPLPVKAVIVQEDGYKMVFWELDE